MYKLRRMCSKMSEEDYSVKRLFDMKRRSLKQVLEEAWKLFVNDIKSAKWAIAFVIAYFVFLKRILHSMCPMVVFTGFPCPGCGLTRAGFAVLRLDFARAWQTHPFIYPLMVLTVLFCINRYLLKKQKMPVLKNCLIVVLASMIFFYIWRMYRYFPGEPPMSYYKYNVIGRMIHLLQL